MKPLFLLIAVLALGIPSARATAILDLSDGHRPAHSSDFGGGTGASAVLEAGGDGAGASPSADGAGSDGVGRESGRKAQHGGARLPSAARTGADRPR